ncbi:hypothetical protein QYM36_019225 [Artemia franciscana]|uniref:C-type lectin domain-containing protein n=1 Tax=Artemia franciscana TaxID=6661 RepID=A0AA88KT73_ARTSF|nr:hypothetical protein QYM36_019225 [Artemia franciscana]
MLVFMLQYLEVINQKKSSLRFGLSCDDKYDLICTGETLNDCSCLQFYDGECVRYSTAELICNGYGGYLPIVNSKLKNKFVFVYPNQFKYGAWIGLKKNDTGFFWADGSELTDNEQNWNPPSNSSTGDGNCVHYVGDEELEYVAVDFAWKDSPCDENRPLVCEKKPISTTTTDSQPEKTTTETTPIVSQSETTATVSQSGTTVTEQPGVCPQGYDESCFNTICYCYGVKKNTPMYWGNAVATCRSEGADLVSIHSDDENKYVSGILDGANAWIGCLYSSTNWVDGSDLSYKNWRTTYNDHTAGYMNNAAYNGKWLTVSNFETQLYFVCKKLKE